MQRLLSLLCLLVAGVAFAEDAKAKAAREELERQLSQMVGKQPTRVRVDYAGLDEPNYQIEEAVFELDGRRLGAPTVRELSDDGTHLVWSGDVTPGKHTVKVALVFVNASSIVVSDEGGYKWRVGGDVSFTVNSGIEVRVTVAPKRDAKQADIAKRFKLALPAQPVMVAALDDGKMPEPPPKPVVVAPVDAGTPPPLVALTDEPKKTKAELAAEEKKQKAEAAAEAKRVAAEERKQKAAAVAEAKRLAAEEKKRKVAEDREAARIDAADRKRKAEEARQFALESAQTAKEEAEQKEAMLALARQKAGMPDEAQVVDAGAVVAVAEPVDAGVAPVDAGAPVVAARVEPDAGPPVAAAQPPPTEESGPPWLLLGAAGFLVAVVLLIVLARRSAKPPTLDD